MTMPLENLAINTIRTLAMDAVQAANSGHPGTPMALAPVAYLLYNERLKYAPQNPLWMARDRFVLSCGHASTLLYAMLHLSGVQQFEKGQPTGELAVPIEHLQRFRQLGSRCPGHPEWGHTSGVEVTTGPLGQGLAMSVGLAMAGSWLAQKYNRDGKDLFGFRTYALCGDGDMMEGVSNEAASLAGHLKLSNLCWIYDDNKITIEGDASLAFSEDVGKRFEALGWNVLKVADVNDLAALREALDAFDAEKERPTLIIVKSVIGFGSPNKAGTADVHGAPLGEAEVALAKENLGWKFTEKFFVPQEVRELFAQGIGTRGAELLDQWMADWEAYRKQYPQEALELEQIQAGELPSGWGDKLESWPENAKGVASRNSSGKALNQLAAGIPWLLGGSADLAPSNKSDLVFPEAGDYSPENRGGRNFHFGIREFAMAAISNGMATTGLRSYCATFFVFSDYLRPAVRLSAMMRLPVLYLFTHDSIGVGEDGPTHQPVEHLAAMRAIPHLVVMRPADANEVRYAYQWFAENRTLPMALVLTRQNLPTFPRGENTCACACNVARGAYVLCENVNPATGSCDVILMGSGSEVQLCVEAQKQLAEKGIFARVVSVPSMELFAMQSPEYQESVLPKSCTKRVAVEAGIEQGWRKWLGFEGIFIGMSDFGASAPYAELYSHFGITTDAIVTAAQR
ncbi:MAG: transketolase [Planctomycetia bacterium]|nr:transketolase [Planctomycetia bacterium]